MATVPAQGVGGGALATIRQVSERLNESGTASPEAFDAGIRADGGIGEFFRPWPKRLTAEGKPPAAAAFSAFVPVADAASPRNRALGSS